MMECEGFGEVEDKKWRGENVKGIGEAKNEIARLVGLGRGGVSMHKKNQAEGCEFSQPLRKIL